MNYFNKDSIKVFPSSYRTAVSGGNFTSEKNFVNIINSIVDRDRYVLSTEKSLINREPLRIVLHGYYFEIEGFNLVNYPTFRVAIKVEKGSYALVNIENSSTQAKDIDVNNSFEGLAYVLSTDPFVESDKDHYDWYQLQVSRGGQLVNKLRLSSDSVFDSSSDETSPKSVSETLSEKQDIVTAGNGIKGGVNNRLLNNKVELIDVYNGTLNSMKDGVGSSKRPVYVNSSGIVKFIESDSGVAATSGTVNGVNYLQTQAALVRGGEFQSNGVSLYASIDSPPDNFGSNGDFWFKYTSKG